MGAGKNKSHRKKRISKHVLQAEERRKKLELGVAEDDRGDDDDDDDARVSKKHPIIVDEKEKKKKEKNDDKIKDPKEGASYLSLWKHDRLGSWKFNKNTQSWLYRHMYDSNRVSKTSFALLIEYATEGGDGMKRRLIEDAKRRARRYKDWEGDAARGRVVVGRTINGAVTTTKTYPHPEWGGEDHRRHYLRYRLLPPRTRRGIRWTNTIRGRSTRGRGRCWTSSRGRRFEGYYADVIFPPCLMLEQIHTPIIILSY